MASKLSPVEIVLKGVDRVTGPIGKIDAKINAMQRPVRDLGNAFGKVGASVGRLAFQVGAVGAALGFAAVAGMRKFVNEADALEEAATAAGVSVEALQELRYAASFAGVEAGTLDGVLRKFSMALGQAKLGTGALNATLGKSAPALLKNMKAASSTSEALDLFLDAAERVKDPSLRNALLGAGFGKSGSLLAPMLEGLKDMRQEAHETNNVLSLETVRAAAQTADEFERAGKRAKGLSNVFFAELLPNLLELVRRFNKWTNANKELVQVKVVEFARNISNAVSWLADNLPGAITKIQEIVDAIGGWRNVLLGVVAIKLAPFIASVFALSAALATNPVGLLIVALGSVAGLILEITKNWDSFTARFNDSWFSTLADLGSGGGFEGRGHAALLDSGGGIAGRGASGGWQAAPEGRVTIDILGAPAVVRAIEASGMTLDVGHSNRW